MCTINVPAKPQVPQKASATDTKATQRDIVLTPTYSRLIPIDRSKGLVYNKDMAKVIQPEVLSPYDEDEENEEYPSPTKSGDYPPTPIDDNIEILSPHASEEEVTKSDLIIINNHMMLADASLRVTRSISTVIALANVSCKLIETRRKVLKLPYGAKLESGGGKGWDKVDDDDDIADGEYQE